MSARNRRQGTGRIPTGRKPKVHKPKAAKPRPARRPAVNPLDDPNAVTAPLTYRSINRNANTAANLRYGGQERALAQQQQNIPTWFAAYRAQVQGINQGIQTGYQQAIGDVNARAQQAQTTDNAGRAQLLNAAQQDATSRGATVDPSLFAADAGAGAMRRQGQNDFAGLLQSQGQANNAYLGNLQAASGAGELGQQARIGQQQAGVAADKGAYRSQYASDARDAAVKDQLTRAAFDIPTANAQLSAQTSRQNSRRTAANSRAQRQATSRNERNATITSGPFAGLTHAQVRALSPAAKQNKINTYKSKPGGANGLTPAQRKARQDKADKQTTRITDAEDRWNLYKTQTGKGPDGKVRKPNPSEIKQRLIKEGFSLPEIHLALVWSSSKAWTARDRALAKRLGIKLPKRKPPSTNQKYATNRP